MLLGSNSIERLKKINTLAVEDSDLFPSEYAAIVNVRFFRKKYVSKSLEYAAVMLDEINSPVASSLFEILDCDYDLLPNITSLRCIQDYGLSGVVNGENVLLGNRNLLLSHNIAPLSQEQEATLLTMNRSLFYLAVNNEVVAIILAQYSPDPELQKIVERVGENFNIILETMDCNINEYMVQKRYNLKNTHVIVTDTEESYKMYQVKKKLAKSKETPVMITTRNAIGILSSVEKAKKLSRVLELSILTKFISVLAGLVLTAIAVLAVPMTLSPLWVLVFNVLWMIPIIWISFFGD